MSKVNSDGYINIQGWMVSELNLKGNELLIYAIIYGFSQDGESRFTGSLQYLADWTNSTKQGVQKVLKSLMEKGLLVKEEKVINNIKFCEYKAIKKVDGMQQSFIGYTTELHGGIQQSCTNKLIYNLDNKLETTTKDNIDYIDPNSNEDFESSSSLKNNLNEIKKYLLEKIQDIPTCKNIYSIIEKNNISLEKLKQVINYADENKKGYGFIVKALEENWSLKTNETSKEIKKCPRGHNYNEHAINETRQAKEENEKYSQKIKYLDQLYNSLSASEKKKIDEEAYRKSVTLYGKFVAEKMANMKVKYEILEERIGYEGI